MKLLSRSECQEKIRKDNELLVDENIRLRKYLKTITEKLNNIKASYEPDKIARLKDFEGFCSDLNQKKSKLLEEYSDLSKTVERKKELYYGLIHKQDALEERIYEMNEKEKKLDLRQVFVETLEKEWQKKTN